MKEEPKVPEEQKDPAGVAEATPVPSVGAAAKPAAVADGASGDAKREDVSASNVQEQLTEKQAAIDSLMAKYEDDINNLRSSLESGAAKREKALNDRLAKMQADYDALATKDMDDAQRAAYEGKQAVKRAEAAEARAAELEESLKVQKAFTDTVNYFRGKGIPDSALDFDNGVEGLAKAAWEYLETKAGLNGKEAKPAAPKKPKMPNAPDVLTDGAGGSAHKDTMADLIKQNQLPGESPEATERRIYDMISSGDLPPTILPVGN